MDVWVNFTHATKWQAEGIFKCFFPFKPAATPSATPPVGEPDSSQKNLPLPKRKAFKHAIPLLTEEEISELAKRFAEAIPENELSVSLNITIQLIYPKVKLLLPGCGTSRLPFEEQNSPTRVCG